MIIYDEIGNKIISCWTITKQTGMMKINNIKYNSVFVGYKMVMGEYEDDDDDKWERNKN